MCTFAPPVPNPFSPAGQGSQSDSLVAPVLGPKVPLGHGCSVLKLVPGRQKCPAGHSSGVRAPGPGIHGKNLAQEGLCQVMALSVNSTSLPPLLAQPGTGHRESRSHGAGGCPWIAVGSGR